MYNVAYRWFRDGFVVKNLMAQNTGSNRLKYDVSNAFTLPPAVIVESAQSARVTRVIPSRTNDIYASLFASTLNEKGRYVNMYDIINGYVEGAVNISRFLDDALDFYPVMAISVTPPMNARIMDFIFEVSYMMTFRGAAVVQTNENIIPASSVAPYLW